MVTLHLNCWAEPTADPTQVPLARDATGESSIDRVAAQVMAAAQAKVDRALHSPERPWLEAKAAVEGRVDLEQRAKAALQLVAAS